MEKLAAFKHLDQRIEVPVGRSSQAWAHDYVTFNLQWMKSRMDKKKRSRGAGDQNNSLGSPSTSTRSISMVECAREREGEDDSGGRHDVCAQVRLKCVAGWSTRRKREEGWEK